MKRLSLFILCFFLFCLPHYAQVTANYDNECYVADSICIFYKKGYRYVDTDIRNNDSELSHLLNSLRQAKSEGKETHILIRSGASPDGNKRANERLATNRANELRSYLSRNAGITENQIKKLSTGISWEKLKEMVDTSDMQYRKDVMQILDEPADSNTDNRKTKLMELHMGMPYKYMLDNMFPDLRYSSVLLLKTRPVQSLESIDSLLTARADLSQSFRDAKPGISLKHSITSTFTPLAVKDNEWSHKLYIKTNAIGLGMLVLNAAVEYDFSDLFSFHLPVYYSGANYFSRRTKFRILGTQPELRIWPTENRRFFAGVHFGVASYNFAIKSGDYRIQDHNGNTPALGGGISVGYRMPFCRNKHFLLEFAIGAGAYRAYYDKFNNSGSGAYHSTVRETYIGIDNAAVSFTYMFNLNKRRK